MGRRGQALREPGEFHAVHGEPPGRVGGRLDPATVRPAAQGVGADPEQACSLLDPETGIQ